MPDGTVRTEADYERMSLEFETMDIDVDKLRRTAKFRIGHPPLGDGQSSVNQDSVDQQVQVGPPSERDVPNGTI